MERGLSIRGLRQIALVSPDARRAVDFYTALLGLHVRQDGDSSSGYHLSFGDTDAAEGSISILEQAGAPAGEIGIGAVHHVAFIVESYDALLKWKRWLQDQDVLVAGPYNQQAYYDLVLTDPDGVLIELATRGPGWAATEDGEEVYHPPLETIVPYRDESTIDSEIWRNPVTQIEPDMRLGGLHHVSTIASSLEQTDGFYRKLGLPLVRKTIDAEDSEVQRWYWGLEGGRPGTLVAAFPVVHPDEGGTPFYGRVGAGVPHHVTLAAEGSPDSWESELAERGIDVVPGNAGAACIDIKDPDGLQLELAADKTAVT